LGSFAATRRPLPKGEAIQKRVQKKNDLVLTHVTLHGVFMDVFGIGVLLTGVSGVGKSELALELLARKHRLVADDATEFARKGAAITGRCPPLLQGFLEARSLGILNIRKLYGAQSLAASKTLDLIIELDAPIKPSSHGLERLSGTRGMRNVLGLAIAEISIPIRLGHNLAVLVEAACRDQKLRLAGYNADDDLMRRQLSAIRKAGNKKRKTGK
jgi:HPr kinase/phosphorylase